ncbi:MAG TPA: PrsW family glutamic-type intramembrane protease [Syntrophorhabdaceae bacterium]|nr:PrsW family glutamic-type intramembrane protease [Syntrophorhabdaceae bacterium]
MRLDYQMPEERDRLDYNSKENIQLIAKPPGRKHWLSMLSFGLLLFLASVFIMFYTGNLNLYPTVLIIGNFLTPAVFVIFFYDRQHTGDLRAGTVFWAFVVGGLLGVLGASVLEPLLITRPGNREEITLFTAMIIGLVEEGVKIAAVVVAARGLVRYLEMDGVVLGAAVGMGFAAFESTGYAFTTLIMSRGNLLVPLLQTVIRGLIAPFGHGVWTAILGAALFREAHSNHFHITGRVLLLYLFVSILHCLWNGLSGMFLLVIPPGIPVPLVPISVIIVGIITLAGLYGQAWRQQVRVKG